jgi:hypothetical protein
MEARGTVTHHEKSPPRQAHEDLGAILWRLPLHTRLRVQLTQFLRPYFSFSQHANSEEFTLGLSLFTITGLLAGWVVLQNYSGDLFARSGLGSSSKVNERDIASRTLREGEAEGSEADTRPASSASVERKSVVLLAGGGCESAQTNGFAPGFTRAIQDYQKAGVELRVLFGSPYTARALRDSLGTASRAFHARSFEEEIARLVESRRWNAGDSILIQLATHSLNTAADSPPQLCYDIPEDASVTARGSLSALDIREAVQRLRAKHPEVTVAVLDQTSAAEDLFLELRTVPGMCTLWAPTLPGTEGHPDEFNQQLRVALTHGWPITRSFESALKDRYLRTRKNHHIPQLSGIPSRDLRAVTQLIAWAGEASAALESLPHAGAIVAAAGLMNAPPAEAPSPEQPQSEQLQFELPQAERQYPEQLLSAVATLTGLAVDPNPGDFALTWTEANDITEKLHTLAFQRGVDGSEKSLKRLRALRRVANRVRERMQRIKEHAEAISAKWVAAERNDDIIKGAAPQRREERDWALVTEAQNDLRPLFLELNRLRLRLGDLYRLLRELDPDALIQDESGARQLEAWQSCADFRLHVRLK